MAAPTIVANTNNAFIAPVAGFPYAQAAAVLELQNGDTVTLTVGTLVALITTAATKTGPVQVQRAVTSGQSNLNIGIVVGENAPPSNAYTPGTGTASQSGPQAQSGSTLVCVQGICLAINGAVGTITAGDNLFADTTTRGRVADGGASGAVTAANIGNMIGVAISSAATTTNCLMYVTKF